MATIEQVKAIKSLSLHNFMIELESRLAEYENKTDSTNERAVDLEQAVYLLLRLSKPDIEKYKSVEAILRPLQPQLRNPALYNLACKRACIAGTKYVTNP